MERLFERIITFFGLLVVLIPLCIITLPFLIEIIFALVNSISHVEEKTADSITTIITVTLLMLVISKIRSKIL